MPLISIARSFSAPGLPHQVVVLRQHHFCEFPVLQLGRLAAEAVQGPALPLQGIHHVKGCDSLAPGVLCVGDCIPDNILQEHLQRWQGNGSAGVMPLSEWCDGVVCCTFARRDNS